MANTDLNDIHAAQSVKIIGADSSGTETYPANVTVDGRIRVQSSTYVLGSILINLYQDASVSPVAAAQWHDLISYMVPAGYDLDCISLSGTAGANGTRFRAVKRKLFGSWNMSTAVFVDGEFWILPRFSAEMYVFVTSAIGSDNNTLSITYTNQDNVPGRTGTVTVPKNSLAGTRHRVTLQAEDYGVLDVTGVSQSIIQSGVVSIEGYTGLMRMAVVTAGEFVETVRGSNAVVVSDGETVILQYMPNLGATLTINPSLVAILNPKAA